MNQPAAEVYDQVTFEGKAYIAVPMRASSLSKTPCTGCAFHPECKGEKLPLDCVPNDLIWVKATDTMIAEAVANKLTGKMNHEDC